MDCFCIGVFEQVGSDIKTTEFFSMDYKGYFPVSLMNIVLTSFTKQTKTNEYKKLLELDKKMMVESK